PPRQPRQDRDPHEESNESSEGAQQQLVHCDLLGVSTITSRARLNSFSRTLRRYAGSASRPCCFSSPSCAASALSGSTSACALSVSISTARRDCTIRWSAEACARLMSDETWLCAVLIAASADSTSAGGSIPVMSDASSTTP